MRYTAFYYIGISQCVISMQNIFNVCIIIFFINSHLKFVEHICESSIYFLLFAKHRLLLKFPGISSQVLFGTIWEIEMSIWRIFLLKYFSVAAANCQWSILQLQYLWSSFHFQNLYFAVLLIIQSGSIITNENFNK